MIHFDSKKRIFLKSLAEGLKSLLYPWRCPVCEKLLWQADGRICADCRDKLKYCEEPLCLCCGRPVWNYYVEYCDGCAGRRFNFEKGFSLFQYDPLMRKLIADFKFKGKAEYADFFAEELAERYGRILLDLKPDLLVPVPIHKSRLRERGYNQAKLLAEKLGLFTGVECRELIKRTKKTRPQKELNPEERRKNLKAAFAADKKQFDKLKSQGILIKTVILVDDIYTTGSTLSECAGVLKEQGIQSVYFLSLSIGNVI